MTTVRSQRLRTARTAAVIIEVSAMLLLASTGARASQAESSVACNEAAEPQVLAYGQYTTDCEITQATDLDRFVVDAQAGDTLRITLDTLTPGLDAQVEVRDPSGAVLTTPACNGHAGPYYAPATRCSFLADVPIASGGLHQLAVSDSGADNGGGYLLQVEIVPPSAGLPALPYNLSIFDETLPQTDRDCWSWQAALNTSVRFTLLSHQPGLDAELEIRDPSGALVTTQSCNGHAGPYYAPESICSFTQDVSPTVAGVHTACVRDVGADNAGAYELNLQCLFGACPLSNRPPQLTPIGSRSTVPGQPLVVDLSAQDPDDDALAFSAIGAPAGSTLTDHGDGTATFSWTPDAAGEVAMAFKVSDDRNPPLSSTEKVLIVVGTPNAAPTITPIGQQSVVAGNVLDVPVSAQDGDGDALRFEAPDLPPGASLVDHADGTASLTWAPTLAQVGNYIATVRASDDGVPVKTGETTVAIRVLPPPIAESSIACSEAQEPQTLAYGQYTTDCVLAQATDLDRFLVAAQAGDTMRITVRTLTPGLDAQVEVRDPTGAVLTAPSCNGHAGPYYAPEVPCSFLVDVPIATSGLHQLAFSDAGANNAGSYVLQVELVPPPSGLTNLPYNLAVVDESSPQTDRDCWSWEATAGTEVRFTLLSHQPGLDAEVEIRDPSGAPLATQACNGHAGPYYAPESICSLVQDVSPVATGPHTVCVRDNGADNGGTYELDLQCLAGACPTGPVVPPTTSPSSTSTTTTTSSSTSSSSTTSVTPSTTTSTYGPASTSSSSTLAPTSSSTTTTSSSTTTMAPTTLLPTTTTTTTSTAVATSSTTSTLAPHCGNGVLDAGEQCDPAADSSPCVGRAPCHADCLCPGNSCHDLPDSEACNDLDDCTDDDACHARVCGGVEKCKLELSDKSPVPSKKPVIPVTIVAKDEVAGARCTVRLFEAIPGARVTTAATATASDPLPGIIDGRRLSKVAKGKIGRSGSLTLNVRLNRIAKRLFKQGNVDRSDAVAEVTITEQGGRKRLLRQLVKLVRS